MNLMTHFLDLSHFNHIPKFHLDFKPSIELYHWLHQSLYYTIFFGNSEVSFSYLIEISQSKMTQLVITWMTSFAWISSDKIHLPTIKTWLHFHSFFSVFFYFGSCKWVWIRVWVLMSGVCVCIWRPEDNLGCCCSLAVVLLAYLVC